MQKLNKIDKIKASIKNFRKKFENHLKTIKTIVVSIHPLLDAVKEGEFVPQRMTPKVRKAFKERLVRNKKLFQQIFQLKIKNISYDETKNIMTLNFKTQTSDLDVITYGDFKNKKNLATFAKSYNFQEEYSKEDILVLYAKFFNQLLELAPDTWMEGDIVVIKEGEIDKKEYLFNFKYNSFTWK